MICAGANLPLPGEGRGPVGKAEVTEHSGRSHDLSNWAPAFAGEQRALRNSLAS